MTHVRRVAGLALVSALSIACSSGADRSDNLGTGGTWATGGAAGVGGAGGVAGFGGAGGAAGVGGAGGSVNLADVKLWAEQVTLGTEFGGDGQVVARWTQSPTLSVISGTAADRADLLELVPTLSALMAPLSIQVVGDGDTSAKIQVHFTDLASFDSIAQANSFSYVPGNWGYFYMFWNSNHELTKTFVLIATDKLSGDKLRHFTFEEMTQSLGLASDSSIFDDSVFYASGSDGGSATELSALDQKLVEFVYTDLQPGDGKAQLDAAFDAYW